MISRAGFLKLSNVLFVDVNGRDDYGVAGDPARPFETITAALAVAEAGDTIFVRPGAYDENNLLKDGVNLHFQDAEVTYTGDGACGIFDDGPNGTNAPVVANITGNGRFTFASTYADTDETGAVHITNVDSDVRIEGDEFSNVGTTAAFSAAVFAGNGSLQLRANRINTALYGVWWKHGPCRIDVQQITATGEGQCVYAPMTTAPDGALFVRAHQIISDIGNAIQTSAASPLSQVWIEALEIMSNGQTCLLNGGKVYITAQKLGTTADTANEYAITFGGGKAWISAQKISGKAIKATNAAGLAELRVNVQNFDEDTGSTDNVISIGQNTLAFIECFELVTTSCNGLAIVHAGATCHFSGRIKTTGATSKNPILISANGALRLKNAVLIADGSRDTIETTATPTVIAYSSFGKTAVDGAVTMVGDWTVNASFA